MCFFTDQIFNKIHHILKPKCDRIRTEFFIHVTKLDQICSSLKLNLIEFVILYTEFIDKYHNLEVSNSLNLYLLKINPHFGGQVGTSRVVKLVVNCLILGSSERGKKEKKNEWLLN